MDLMTQSFVGGNLFYIFFKWEVDVIFDWESDL